MKIRTLRFGEVEVHQNELITFPEGILGFPELKKYCLIDPGDDTLILWLQSIDDANIAFPVLEPKIFKPDYTVRLSAQELAQLKLENINTSVVFNILTIPKDVTQMTANLKAPLVINLKEQIGKQVILQENENVLKYPIFNELRKHLTTIASTQQVLKEAEEARIKATVAVDLKTMLPSNQVKSLN
jgi:flagellar assembly factor FliW